LKEKGGLNSQQQNKEIRKPGRIRKKTSENHSTDLMEKRLLTVEPGHQNKGLKGGGTYGCASYAQC